MSFRGKNTPTNFSKENCRQDSPGQITMSIQAKSFFSSIFSVNMVSRHVLKVIAINNIRNQMFDSFSSFPTPSAFWGKICLDFASLGEKSQMDWCLRMHPKDKFWGWRCPPPDEERRGRTCTICSQIHFQLVEAGDVLGCQEELVIKLGNIATN